MIQVGNTLLAYAGVALLIANATRASLAAQQAALRGAWLAAFVAASVDVITHCVQGTVNVSAHLSIGVGAAIWTAVIVCTDYRLAWLGAFALATEAALRGELLTAMTLFASTALGVTLARAMITRTYLVFRTSLHWLSFAGTFGVLVPAAIADRTSGAGAPVPYAAAILTLTGFVVAASASWAFFRAGGTPEPLDPPTRMVTDGPYAYLRHPIQLAEIFFIVAGFALFPQRYVAIYALVFSVALVGPLRRYEESKLEARFGDAFRAWRARVPAYLPVRYNSEPFTR